MDKKNKLNYSIEFIRFMMCLIMFINFYNASSFFGLMVKYCSGIGMFFGVIGFLQKFKRKKQS